VWGDSHWWLSDDRILSANEKERHLDAGVGGIEELIGSKPISFRAPYMVSNVETLDLIERKGFRVDSSGPAYFGVEPAPVRSPRSDIIQIPVSANPRPAFRLRPYPHWQFEFLQTSMLTLRGIEGTTAFIRDLIAYQITNGIEPHAVMLCHPWEFVDHPNHPDRSFAYSCKENISHLRTFLHELGKRFEVEFLTMGELSRGLPP
jgi:peptidoglycan/xylan/chitin deacetylase (PgdA/CDA1 family)